MRTIRNRLVSAYYTHKRNGDLIKLYNVSPKWFRLFRLADDGRKYLSIPGGVRIEIVSEGWSQLGDDRWCYSIPFSPITISEFFYEI